jgi:hypothetical protein
MHPNEETTRTHRKADQPAEPTGRRPAVSHSDIKQYAIWLTAAILTGAVGFAHGKLWSHETDIAVIQSKQETAQRDGEKADKRMERIENLLQEMLREMRRAP